MLFYVVIADKKESGGHGPFLFIKKPRWANGCIYEEAEKWRFCAILDKINFDFALKKVPSHKKREECLRNYIKYKVITKPSRVALVAKAQKMPPSWPRQPLFLKEEPPRCRPFYHPNTSRSLPKILEKSGFTLTKEYPQPAAQGRPSRQ